MLFDHRPAIFASLTASLLLSLAACANSPNSKTLEDSLAADPRLTENPVTPSPSPSSNPQKPAKPTADFPDEIPLYPEANFKEVKEPSPSSAVSQGKQVSWTTTDPSNLIQSFYQKAFQSNGWQIVTQQAQVAPTDTLVARGHNLKVTLSIQTVAAQNNLPTSSPSATAAKNSPKSYTEFSIQYVRENGQATATSPGTLDAGAGNGNLTPTQPDAVTPSPTPETNSATQVFADVNKTPPELRQYVEDLAALGILTPSAVDVKSKPATGSPQFAPNKTISRREYARWLVAANNKIYANNPGKQIRLIAETSQPAFQDVPKTDPDFPAIQGLAEAGLIPNSLTGEATAVLFRPDTPLTRENLILWKVPLDTRQALPNATVEAVKQTWGFQDAGKIEPKALRAILADFQNGDSSNIKRVFGYTTLFQPKKAVFRAEAAGVIWYFGAQGEGLSAKDGLQVKPIP